MKIIKAKKLDVLRFILDREIIHIGDLANEFDYSYPVAYNRLHRLEKQNLVEKLGAQPGMYCLTTEGDRRLEYRDQ